MDNEQSERGKGGEEQRVDMTFPQMSIIMSLSHTHTHTNTHSCKNCHLLKSIPIWKKTVCHEAIMIEVLVKKSNNVIHRDRSLRHATLFFGSYLICLL